MLHWADLHGDDPQAGPDGAHQRRVGNVLVQIGGEGTPGVQDFCLGELAIVRGTGATALRNLMADLLDLRHRLPQLWALTVAAACEPWLARRIARMSRTLGSDRVGLVDTALSRIITRESAARVIEVAEAAVIQADPDAHAERLEEARRRRFAALGRTDETGLRTVIARVTIGDAAAIDAVLARVAEILRPAHEDWTTDELRAEAMGYLARPADLLRVLLEGLEQTEQTDPPTELPRALALPADILAALKGADLEALRPRTVLHLHLHQDVLAGHADGVARAEGIGPVLLEQVEDLLRHRHVTLTPVLDLSDRVRSTAYEHPASIKNRIHLTTGGDYFPYATSTRRHVDYDHPTPYDATGPPGQTGVHNSGPLGRRHHRWKTHAGYTARQAGQGRYVWRTPHGYYLLVDHTGTRWVDPEVGHAILEAPAGVDLYPGIVVQPSGTYVRARA